jgi:hypothetical protein
MLASTLPCHVRRLEAVAAVGDGVVVGGLGRFDLQGQVGDSVPVRSDPLAEPGSGPHRAAEDEPRVARLEHVRGLIRAAGLRAAVGDPPHAERRRVVVRRLLRVPHCEHHGVHADDPEAVLRWRSRVNKMRNKAQNAQTSSSILVSLTIYTE